MTEPFDITEEWNANEGALWGAFVALMEQASEMNIPIIAHVAVSASDEGAQISGGMVDRDKWIPPQFGDMFEFMNLDQEGQEFVSHAIKMARANMAQKQAREIADQAMEAVNIHNAMTEAEHASKN